MGDGRERAPNESCNDLGKLTITQHAYEAAENRLDMSSVAFRSWVQSTCRGWMEMSLKYFTDRGLRLYEDNTKRYFLVPWTTSVDLCMLIRTDMDFLVTLLWFHNRDGDVENKQSKEYRRKIESLEKQIKQLNSQIRNLKYAEKNAKVSQEKIAKKLEKKQKLLEDELHKNAELRKEYGTDSQSRQQERLERERVRYARGGWADEYPEEEEIDMVLPREAIQTGGSSKCTDCGAEMPIRVLHSNAGYYLGTMCEVGMGNGDCGPHSRESGYYKTEALAQEALDNDDYSR